MKRKGASRERWLGLINNYKQSTFRQFTLSCDRGDMTWSCPVCQKEFSRKDNMQRHVNSQHSLYSGFAPSQSMSSVPEKCERFHMTHPFTCMIAGMTGSGKTIWVQSLLQQAQNVIDQPPQRIIWCYSQW